MFFFRLAVGTFAEVANKDFTSAIQLRPKVGAMGFYSLSAFLYELSPTLTEGKRSRQSSPPTPRQLWGWLLLIVSHNPLQIEKLKGLKYSKW